VYALALGAALLLGAPEPTHAVTTPRTLPFFDSLTIVPEAPFAGQAVGFTVRAGFCNAILAPLVAGDERRELVQDGNTIRVTVDVVFQPDPILCFFVPTTTRFNLRPLPSGDYRLELYGRNNLVATDVRLVAATTFTVGSAAEAVPALSLWSMLALGLLLAFAALLWPRFPRASHDRAR
jgi:hypothetical protein